MKTTAKKIIAAFLTVFLMTTVSYSQTIITSLGNVSECPGDSIVYPIDVVAFNNVASISLVINFDTNYMTYGKYQNLAPGLGGSQFMLNVVNIDTNNPAYPTYNKQVRISWYTFGGPPLNLGTASLIDFVFYYKGGAATVAWSTVPDETAYSDAALNILPADFIDGSVSDANAVINSQPIDINIDEGLNASFNVDVTGAAAYQWQESTDSGISWNDLADGGIYSGSLTSTLTLTGVTIGMDGYNYQCIISDPCSSFPSDIVTLTVNPVANPLEVVASANPDDICFGQATQLDAAAAGGSGTYSYIWISDPAGFNSTMQNPTDSPTLTTTYTVTVDDGLNTATDQVVVTVNPLPLADAGADAIICEDTSYALMGTASNQSATLWTTNGDGVFDDATLLGAVYTPGPLDIANGSIDLTLTSDATSPCTTAATDDMTLSIQLLPIANAGQDEAICDGDCITLTASGGITYFWSNSATTDAIDVCPAATSIYIVTVTGANGCTDSDNVTVTVVPLPTVYNVILPPSGGGYCIGGSGVDICVDGWESGVNYELYFNGNSTGLVTGGQAGGFCFGSQTAVGTYTVIATTVTGNCSISLNGTPNVFTIPLPLVFNITGGGSYCGGGSGMEVGIDGSEAGVNYELFLDGISTGNVIAGNGTAINFGDQTAAGTYTVIGTNNCGPSNMNGSVDVIITALTSISSQPINTTVLEGANASFSLLAENVISYQWQLSVDGGTIWTDLTNTIEYNGVTTNTLQISNVPMSMNNYQYLCVVTGLCNTILSNPAVLNISQSLTTITTTAISQIVATGVNTVVVPIFASNFVDVSAIALRLTYNNNVLVYDSLEYVHPGISKQTLIDFATGGQVNIAWVDVVPANIGSDTIFKLRFKYNGGSSYLVWNTIPVSNCEYANSSGALLPTIFINGWVNPANSTPITTQPTDISICEGSNADFTIVAPGASTYQWQESIDGGLTWIDLVDGGTYNGSATPILSLVNVPFSMNDVKYQCLVDFGTINEAISDAVVLTVTPWITDNVIVTSDMGNTICTGTAVTFSANVSSSISNPQYTWMVNAAVVGNSPTYTTSTINDGDIVSCAIISFTSCFAGIPGEITMTVMDVPGKADTPTGDVSLCENSTDTDYSTTGAAFATSYTWEISPVSAGTISGTGTTATVDWNTTFTGLVTIRVKGINNCGEGVFSDDLTVTVNQLPTADAGPDVAVCDGDCTNLIASGGISYLWSNSATTASIDVCPANTTIYTVTVTDVNGCTDMDDVTVTVNPLPTADAGPDAAVCDGDCTTLTATGGITYIWNYGQTDASINACPLVTTTYTVTVTDANGCTDWDDVTVTVNPLPTADAGQDVAICDGDCTNLTASGGVTYLWSNGGTDATNNVCPSAITIYSVTVTDANGCTDMDDVTVTVNPLPIADAGPDQSVCDDDCTDFIASGAGVGGTYLWSTGETDATINVCQPWSFWNSSTTYTVTITDVNGCTDADDVTITAYRPVNVDAGTDFSICAGASDTITVDVTGWFPPPTPYTYIWSTGDTVYTQDYPVSPGVTTTYTVTVVSADGCTGSDDVVVSIDPIPAVFNVTGGGSYCIGGTGVEVGLDGSETGTDYELFLDGVSTTNTIAGTGSAISYGDQAALGTYTVEATNNCGTVSMNGNAVVDLYPAINITTQPLDISVGNGNPANFNLTATGATSYQWQVSIDGGMTWIDVSDGGIYSGATTNSLNINPATIPMDGYQYQCIVTDVCSSVISNAATLTVIAGGGLITIADSVDACIGDTILFPVEVVDFYSVASISLSLEYNDLVLDYLGLENVHPQLSSGILIDNSFGGYVKIAWVTTSSSANIGSATLMNMKFVYNGGTSNMIWDTLTGGQCQYSDSLFNILPATFINGVVTPGGANIILQPIDVTINTGGNASFDVGALGATSYQWQVDTGTGFVDIFDGGVYSGTTTPTMNITGAWIAMDSYQYQCIVTGPCVTVTSNPAILTVNPKLIRTIAPDMLACAGNIVVPILVENFDTVAAISLTLAYDTTVLTYTGYQNLNPELSSGTLLINASGGEVITSYYSFSPANIGNGTLIEFLFTYNGSSSYLTWDTLNQGACQYSDLGSVILPAEFVSGSINPGGPEIVSQPISVTIFDGNNTSFDIVANGATSYQWQVDNGFGFVNVVDGGVYSGATTGSLNITPASVSMNGYQYQCILNGLCGQVISNLVTLTVLPAQAAIITMVGHQIECPGTIVIPVRVIDYFNVGKIDISLEYDPLILNYTGYQNPNPAIQSGNLSVVAAGGFVNIDWDDIAPSNIGNDSLIELVFTSNGGFSNLRWDSLSNYEDISGSIMNATFINGSVQVDTLPSKPSLPVGPTSLCVNSPNTIYTTTTTEKATSFYWDISPASAGSLSGNDTTGIVDWDNIFVGTVTIAVRGVNSCGHGVYSDSIIVVIEPLPGQAATPTGPIELCKNSPDSDYTTTGAINATSYIWEVQPASAGVLTTSGTSCTIDWNDTFIGTATFSVAGVNNCGAGVFSNGLIVIVHDMPIVDLGPDDDTICANNTITLDAGNPGSFYNWSTGATTQTIVVDSTGVGLGTGTYYVTVTDVNGCIGSDSINITFDPCVGIPENELFDVSINVFPNPNNGIFTLELFSETNDVIDLKIYNSLSVVVYEEEKLMVSGEYSKTIELNNLAGGVYYIILENQIGRFVRKIVIQK